MKSATDAAATVTAKRLNMDRISMTVSGPKGKMVVERTVSADGATLTMTRKGTGTMSGCGPDETLIYT